MTLSLIRGLSLLHNKRGEGFILGTPKRALYITSAHQRSALTQLALGINPLKSSASAIRVELESFLMTLRSLGFLKEGPSELIQPKRYLEEVSDADLAIAALRERSAPEIADSDWRVGTPSGANSVAARSQYPILLSGRSRVITLLYTILLASGVTRVRFADRHLRPLVSNLDIGFGPFTESDIGLNFYQLLEERRRSTSLFPIERGVRHDLDPEEPLLAVAYGDTDPELLMEWSQNRIAHLLIHHPLGDGITVGPLVLPFKSPCLRCFALYEVDTFGATQLERIPLTAQSEVPATLAHYVAAATASLVLDFIDGHEMKGVGEVTYINFQRLMNPQVVSIARHPLCGCDY